MLIKRKFFSERVFPGALPIPVDVKKVNDKELRRISRENKNKINKFIVASELVGSSALLGSVIGERVGKKLYIHDGNLKGFKRGALIGAGVGTGLGLLSTKLMDREAKIARKELNRRYNNKKKFQEKKDN